jgi:putative hydrolase of the HAD superfamily
MPIRAIAFDLDDTLMDTSGILAPKAAKNAFQILIDTGLNLTLDECEQKRIELIRNISHKDVFALLAKSYGQPKTIEALGLANKAFYEPKLPDHLPLLPGALDNILSLKKNYHLYIVTAGYENAQIEKVRVLGLDRHFKKVFVVNSLEKERKFSSFQKIIDLEKIQPDELLCIGNSLSSEIADAKKIGAVACYFEFGEDRGSMHDDPKKKPDFHVNHHHQIIPTCKLIT